MQFYVYIHHFFDLILLVRLIHIQKFSLFSIWGLIFIFLRLLPLEYFLRIRA